MKPRAGTMRKVVRKTLKWGGAAVTVLLVVVWVGSHSWQVLWGSAYQQRIGVRRGRVHIHVHPSLWRAERSTVDAMRLRLAFLGPEPPHLDANGCPPDSHRRRTLDEWYALEEAIAALECRLTIRRVPRLVIPRNLWQWDPPIKLGSAAGLQSTGTELLSAAVPIWIVVLAAAAPTYGAWRLEVREARRAQVGHCPNCGYDRRGIPADAVCPECGAVAAAANETAAASV